MDKFITRKKVKKSVPFEDIPGALCIWGPHGCGKTTWVKQTYEDIIEINYDDPKEFMDRIGKTTWVLIDNYEDNDTVDKTYYESLYTRKNTLFICIKEIPEMYCYEFPNKKVIKHFKSEKMDIFKDPKDIISENLKTCSNSYIDLLRTCEGEHGNIIGIIHENLKNSSLNISEISDALSYIGYAMEFDTKMYQGNWDLYQYFNFFGYVYPCSIIKGRVKKIDNATMWSKFLNMKMREKKLKEMNLDMEKIQVLREYYIQENPQSDVDILKYGDFYGRLKTSPLCPPLRKKKK